MPLPVTTTSLARTLRSLWAAWSARREISRLTSLDDAMLRDLGLTRGDVEAALGEGAFADPSWRLRDRRARRLADDHAVMEAGDTRADLPRAA